MGSDTTHDRVLQVNRLAEAGKTEAAYELVLELSHEAEVKGLATVRLALHDALLSQLLRQFPDQQVFPQRLASNDVLKRYSLRTREVFILGLIDGTTTLGEVIAISPVDELDTLRAIAKMTALGLIGFGSNA